MTDPSSPHPREIVVPLHAEDISVDRRITERNVRVDIHTTSHDHLIDEAVAHERVEIDRIAINGPVTAVPPVRQEGDTTVISVVEEVVVVERRLILKEEIHIRRVRTTEQHRETVALREQHAVIERAEPGASLSALPSQLAPIPKPQIIKDENA
jgi:stress response protein YsnF